MQLRADIKQYLDSYGYQVEEEQDKLVFRNSNYSQIMPNVLLSILGLALTIIGIASAYKILLFFILMIFIPLLKLINNYPKEVIIDSNKRKIFDIDFAKV